VAIGLYITFAIVALTIPYYDLTSRRIAGKEQHGLAELMHIAHQKSIDYRLRVRGPRPVNERLALLTVDERAVSTIGRWPWPRSVMAQLLEQAFNNGARLLAFDIAWPEPSENPADQVLRTLKDAPDFPFSEKLLNLRGRLDQDLALGDSFKRHADRIVAGSFTTESRAAVWPPETEFCRDLIFKRSPSAKQWDKEEVLISVIDPFTPYMPQALIDNFGAILDEREKAIRSNFGEVKNKNEEVLLNSRIRDDLHAACDTIMEDFREEFNGAWRDAILANENPKEFTFPSYDSWLENYRDQSKPNSIIYADDWRLNTPVISDGTKHTGFFNTEQDDDGTIRSKALIMRTGNTYFPSIALKAFLVAHNLNAMPKLWFNRATNLKEIQALELTNNETGEAVLNLPVDGQGRLLLNYAGPEQMYPYLSFADLASDSPDVLVEQRVWDASKRIWEKTSRKVKKAEFIKDRIFVVGATATGIYDLRVTPFQENYPGAETHLNAIDNMMQRQFFRSLPNERVQMPLVLLGMGLILTLALTYSGAISGLALVVLTLIATAAVDQFYFFKNGMVISIVWPLILTMSLYVALTFYRYLTEERGKKELRQTFQKYVSPAIVEEILAHPQNIALGGRKARLTIFFSDVRGFTTISEKLDPRDLSDLLNSYLTPMTEIVFKNRGTLDKYMGDAIMAFFGAPIPYNDHAKFACRCALQSLEKLFELKKFYESKGLPAIDIGIGLNTGEVSVGNMGSVTVRSYTVMGDAVNLASRLEGINKQYGTRIILSEMTYNDVKDSFICREVDWVRVKGKALPVKIYELIAEGKSVPNAQQEFLSIYGKGYSFYHEKNWQESLNCFRKALELQPDDEVSKLYVERCEDYIANPPEENWDGVFVMKTK